MKINKHIEILCSTEPGLSSMSKESREAILDALSKHYSRVGITIVNGIASLDTLIESKPDLVFLGMIFLPKNPSLGWKDPNKIWVSEYLESHGIAHTGSNQDAHFLERNKPFAKQCALDANLSTSQFMVVKQNVELIEKDIKLSYPMFVKPANRGGGLGIDSNSVVHNFQQLNSKIQSISDNYQSDSLVEEYLTGREFSIAILKGAEGQDFSVMPLELVAPSDENGNRILSGKVKSSNVETTIEVNDTLVKERVTKLALDVFKALGARDYGRIDIRLDSKGNPSFLEANLLPSLISGYGSFPKACMLNMKISYEAMLLSIVSLAFLRTNSLMPKSLDSKQAISL